MRQRLETNKEILKPAFAKDSAGRQVQDDKIQKGILAPLAFFGLYGLPLGREKIWQLLYKSQVNREKFDRVLADLVRAGKVYDQDGHFALKPWDSGHLLISQDETSKRWRKLQKYYNLLAAIPFIEHISVIHSLALGNADAKSDIDLLVITRPNRLYFVRSVIIVLFRILGVYKTQAKISEQFCFGYYLTTSNMDISRVEGQDNFLAFWFASHIPILGMPAHEKFLRSNTWIYKYFPNYQPVAWPEPQISNVVAKLKTALEFLLAVPALLAEPLFRFIHIRHTFNLPENHWPTSTTIATADALKLHAVSQRKQLNEAFERALQKFS